MLRLADAWTWDFWLADDGRSYHLYFLNAPRHIGHPDERHWNVSIGHAVSPDLADWTVVPDAIAPSDGPAFDHIAAGTATGSCSTPASAPSPAPSSSASAWPHLLTSITGASIPARPSWKAIPAGMKSSRTRCSLTKHGATRGCLPTPTA